MGTDVRLERWALMAEVVSAAAIVLSLIFVGVQIQQNSEETASNSEAIRGQVRQAMLQTEKDLVLFAGQNNVLVEPILPENFQKQLAVLLMMIRTRENYWIAHEKGLLDDETYLSYRSTFINNLQNSAMQRETWQRVTSSTEFNSDFVAEIDAALTVRSE
jgi:hypothetical protein